MPPQSIPWSINVIWQQPLCELRTILDLKCIDTGSPDDLWLLLVTRKRAWSRWHEGEVKRVEEVQGSLRAAICEVQESRPAANYDGLCLWFHRNGVANPLGMNQTLADHFACT